MAVSTSKLRFTGFTLTVLGALLAGLGALLEWGTLTIGSGGSSFPPLAIHGTDIIEGKIALIAAAAALVAALLMRVGNTQRARPTFIWLALVAGIVAVAAPALTALRAEERLSSSMSASAVTIAAVTGAKVSDVTDQLKALEQVSLRPGIWICIVGGAIAIAGAVLSLRWAHAGKRDQHSEPDLPAATSPDLP